MNGITLSPQQLAVAQASLSCRLFLEGVAGTGKTTAGVARMHYLLKSEIPADRLLVLTPQRTLAQPYYDALRSPDTPGGGVVTVTTIGGLARRMIDLFWPLVAEEVGFQRPADRPVFLTLETAQYYMARIVTPLIEEEGYFDATTIDRNRLYSQILDNLNKAAVVGFPPGEIGERLKGAWMGDLVQARIYDQAQACALRFRRYCLAHNLLDFSLQIAVFAEHLWEEPLCRDHLTETYTHLIFDNVEEDTPVAHDIVYSWLGTVESGLVIFDHGAGYRSFLGADPVSGHMLQDLCDEQRIFVESFVMSGSVTVLGAAFDRVLRPSVPDGETAPPIGDAAPLAPAPTADSVTGNNGIRATLHFGNRRFHHQMLDWVVAEIQALVRDKDAFPGDIVVLAPFLTDSLRFSLAHRLHRVGIPVRSHRPSRALRDEPATQTLLTLAALAHPEWEILPSRYDVTDALRHAIHELDLVRAQLLAQIVYRPHRGQPELTPFDEIQPDMQQRITFVFGGRYEALRTWLAAYRTRQAAPLDHFLSRLFGEVLSQPGFGFHRDVDCGLVAAMLVESVQKFRWISADLADNRRPLGREYLEMVRQGVIAAQYLAPWQEEEQDAVLLAPAYTFLLSNRPVAYQFWLDVGGLGWWERLYQPLTHPFVLSRRWPTGKVWTDADEHALRQRGLQRLVLGLVRRCRVRVYLGLSDYSEQGFEQEGPLLGAVQQILRRFQSERGGV